jgi:hypothetical protein
LSNFFKLPILQIIKSYYDKKGLDIHLAPLKWQFFSGQPPESGFFLRFCPDGILAKVRPSPDGYLAFSPTFRGPAIKVLERFES